MTLDEEWSAADRLSRQGAWEAAGAAWMALARRCAGEGMEARARDAASRAADALRRDDRPAEAGEALSLAWRLGQRTTVDALQLVAVRLDAGQVRHAVELAEAARTQATAPTDRALALDGACNALLAAGRVEEARAALGAMEGLGAAATQLACLFRRATFDRLDGRLGAADRALAAVATALEPYPAAASGLAAALDERAELALLRAELAVLAGRRPEPDAEAAAALVDEAATAWARARRRAGRLRNEALAALVAHRRGLGADLDPVDAGLAFARARGLRMFAAELGAWRAALGGDRGGLDPGLAGEAPLGWGRALVGWAEGGGPAPGDAADRVAALGEAEALLGADLPWRARALGRRAALTGDAALAEEARTLATAALTDAES